MILSPADKPDTAPIWLKQWPAQQSYKNDFPAGIRQSFFRLSGKMQFSGFIWMDDGLRCRVDSRFITQWIFDQNKWSMKCTCQYPKDNCVHTYGLAVAIDKIFQEKGWDKQQVASYDARQQTAPVSKAPKTSAKIPNSLSKYTQGDYPQPKKFAPEAVNKLTVEIDLKLNPGMATLRFYNDGTAKRSIIRMQKLYNIVMGAAHGRIKEWPDEDLEFLRWMQDKISDRHIWKQNLEVHKIYLKAFEEWIDRWKVQPGRFIDRETQQNLGFKIVAKIHFEAEILGEKTKLHCFVSTEGQNKQPFYKLYSTIRQKNMIVINKTLVQLDVPIAWQTLVDFFSKKSPSLPTAKASEILPTILENRLELLQGKTVRRNNQSSKISLMCFNDNGQIVIDAKAGKSAIILDSELNSASLKLRKNHFEITEVTSPELQTCKEFLRALQVTSVKPGLYQVEGKEDHIARFAQLWRLLPKEIERSHSSSLNSLLGQAAKLESQINIRENQQWLDYSVHWEVGGVKLSPYEIESLAHKNTGLVRSQSGHWLQIDQAQIQNCLEEMDSLNLSKTQGRVLQVEAKTLIEQISDTPDLRIHKSSRQLADSLRTKAEPEAIQLHSDFSKILRPYQRDGFDFITTRLVHKLGIILADDMGLGKTVQTLSVIRSLSSYTEKKAPTLVIAPASVVYVWQSEALKFAPDMKVAIVAGTKTKRDKLIKNAHEYDILISSYSLIRNDIDSFRQQNFSLTVLDEAQQIKNPKAKATQAVKQLNSQYRIALSGTPLENKLTDLWSICDFINPGFLGIQDDFENRYEKIQVNRKDLSRKMKPIMLRRTKDKVATELPAKTEELITIDMTDEQTKLYNSVMVKAKSEVKEKGAFQIFSALTKLRQVCCDARLHFKDQAQDWLDKQYSAKLNTFMSMVEPIIEEGHSVLVFSQFTSMLQLIEDRLNQNKIRNFKLTGETATSKRPALVQEFNDCPEASTFLLSLKAAGTGLTLTKADYVFIFDPWWNPAAENQAIDRTHRIGQENPVFVYKLVTRDTIEEKILKLQEEKMQMISDVLSDDMQIIEKLGSKDLAALLD
mgnify:CR=1 FL=1